MSSQASTSEVVLFDVACKDDICWSPNTHKPRTVLALKNVSYRTEWLSYPDIEKRLRNHGQESAKTVVVPVLQDGDKYIPDSWAIAKYLEDKVPEPSIFAGGLEAHEKFRQYTDKEVKPIIFKWIAYQIPPILDDRGAKYFTETREKMYGPLQKISMPDDQVLPALRGAITPILHSLRQSGAYIMGSNFSYADSIVLGLLQWVHQADKTKFDKVMALDADGHLPAWWKRCEQYTRQMN